MSAKSMWTIPTQPAVRTPAMIMSEQAQLLASQTNGILQARVLPKALIRLPQAVLRSTSFSRLAGWRAFELRVAAPALGYEVEVATVFQDQGVFPVVVHAQLTDQIIDCRTDQEFETALGEVLSSDRVTTMLAALMAESQALGAGVESPD